MRASLHDGAVSESILAVHPLADRWPGLDGFLQFAGIAVPCINQPREQPHRAFLFNWSWRGNRRVACLKLNHHFTSEDLEFGCEAVEFNLGERMNICASNHVAEFL